MEPEGVPTAFVRSGRSKNSFLTDTSPLLSVRNPLGATLLHLEGPLADTG